MIVGMDFGTTNSGMAVYDGRQVRLLPLDPANANPHVARTALYLTNDQTVTIGRQAIDRYFAENVGRPVKLKRVWVGEIEVYGADMYYVTDVYVWADVLSPGRLFLSIKSGLRDPDYQGTAVGRFYYSLENLIAAYLNVARLRAERLLGQELRQAVLGRPVHFGRDPQADRLAERRLLEAAFRAGYERVYLQYEPIAAAHHYARQVGKPQNILVFDFGGGTLDLTVMRIGDRNGRQVLATGGIPIAGDVFDQKIVRAKVPQHFGEGSYYGPRDKRLPLPKWIFDVFSNWQTIIELQTPESRKLLEEIRQTAMDRQAIDALISLVTNNYSLQMFDTIEAAKRRLSDEVATMIRLKGPGFRVAEILTRSEFEQIIRAEVVAIDQHLDQVVADSGLLPGQIDAVIRTGGSSTIPIFRHLLMDKFGAQKVQAIDTFSSVTSGLGIIGHSIASGQMEAAYHTPDERPALEQAGQEEPGLKLEEPDLSRRPVTAVNMALLRRRMAAQEAESAGQMPASKRALVLLTEERRLRAAAIEACEPDTQPIPLPAALGPGDEMLEPLASPWAASILALDEPLLLLTSRYRFLLSTVAQLLDLKDLAMSPAQFFQLKADEWICTFAPWRAIKQQERLVLVTSLGYARIYPLEGLVESVEGPAPLQFDQPLPGLPYETAGASDEDHLVVALDSGRAVRYRLVDLPLQGIQTINRRDDERIVAARVIQAGAELLLVTAGGYGKRLPVQWIPEAPKANSRGRVMISRRPLAGAARLTAGEPVWALMAKQLRPLSAETLPEEEAPSTRSYRMKGLGEAVEILALVERQ